jgi:hypothetical protein
VIFLDTWPTEGLVFQNARRSRGSARQQLMLQADHKDEDHNMLC